jgi:hypothetical protein
VTYDANGSLHAYIHQRLNRNVFRNPAAVMANIERVLAHTEKKRLSRTTPVVCSQILELVPTRNGRSAFEDDEGYLWRTYIFVEGESRNKATDENDAENAARAFAEFQCDLADLPQPPLHETIANFHNTPRRFNDLLSAYDADVLNRAASAGPEIAFAVQRQKTVTVLSRLQEESLLPQRTVHNDAKLNNILLDPVSGRPLCVIDLDTVMQGISLYDFGDMVRSMTCTANEDERDISEVVMHMGLFRAVAKGYLSIASDFLTPTEIEHLAFSGKLITFETGLRFLTDYLSGDFYFKTHRPGHNLERCRTQFRLVESIEQQEEEMNEVLASLQQDNRQDSQ